VSDFTELGELAAHIRGHRRDIAVRFAVDLVPLALLAFGILDTRALFVYWAGEIVIIGLFTLPRVAAAVDETGAQKVVYCLFALVISGFAGYFAIGFMSLAAYGRQPGGIAVEDLPAQLGSVLSGPLAIGLFVFALAQVREFARYLRDKLHLRTDANAAALSVMPRLIVIYASFLVFIVVSSVAPGSGTLALAIVIKVLLDIVADVLIVDTAGVHIRP
jgi:hypothetical protein